MKTEILEHQKIKLSEISTKAPLELEDSAYEKDFNISAKDFKKDLYGRKTKALHKQITNLHKALRAEEKHSILIVLQGMDASGKDGSVVSLYDGLFPMATYVHSFKAPSTLEHSKDYLWRVHANVPSKGEIGIFNRSHYEDILVPTVHELIDKTAINKRYKHINDFEEMLKDNGTIVLKFYLHISKLEQKKRFKERLTNIEKKWKYNSGDLVESKLWDDYMKVYENIFEKCTNKWHIVPSDDKCYRDYLIAKTLLQTLKSLKPKYPNTVK